MISELEMFFGEYVDEPKVTHNLDNSYTLRTNGRNHKAVGDVLYMCMFYDMLRKGFSNIRVCECGKAYLDDIVSYRVRIQFYLDKERWNISKEEIVW